MDGKSVGGLNTWTERDGGGGHKPPPTPFLTRLRSIASHSFSTYLADASSSAGSLPQNCTINGRSSGCGSKLLLRYALCVRVLHAENNFAGRRYRHERS